MTNAFVVTLQRQRCEDCTINRGKLEPVRQMERCKSSSQERIQMQASTRKQNVVKYSDVDVVICEGQ